MNQHTIECYATDKGWTAITFGGFLSLNWTKTAIRRWTFKRHGHQFEVLSFNAELPQELASVIVDNFFLPLVGREVVSLTRFELTATERRKK